METMNSESTDPERTSLVDRLQRCQDSREAGEGDISTELTAISTHAVHDPNPSYTLCDIAHALVVTGTSSDLDALHAVPLLLDIEDPTADEILSLLAECGNAKETVMAVQESLERLYHDLLSSNDFGGIKVFLRLERLFRLYIGAIPRLKLRRRSASETLKPLFSNVVPVVESVGDHFKRSEYDSLAQLTCRLVSCMSSWSAQQGNEQDHSVVKALCRSILSASVANLTGTKMAQQKFKSCSSRLFQTLGGDANPESDTLLQECFDAALSLSYSIDKLLQERTTGSLVLLSIFLSRAMPSISMPSPNSLLSSVFPVLIAALQSNASIDANLNILLHTLYPSTPNTTTSIDPDYIPPLSSALASIASTMPDPQIRFIAFRILGALLARAPPLEHMTLLRDLLTETPFPSMRVAAVGLLKDAVLEALRPNVGPNPFASPDMLRTFGYIVFRPDPPDLFSKPATRALLESFMETQEPKRLVECLAFYYVLLMRDEHNVTGIRDLSQIKSVEKDFLSPLRDTLNAWAELEDIQTVDEQAGMALAALETNLERIGEAHERLNLKPS
ncbi:hypothetical protein ACEPAI_2947 [Sanghuangporus weigelae]